MPLPFADHFPLPAHTQTMIATAQIVGQTRTAPPSAPSPTGYRLLPVFSLPCSPLSVPLVPYPLSLFPIPGWLLPAFTPPSPYAEKTDCETKKLAVAQASTKSSCCAHRAEASQKHRNCESVSVLKLMLNQGSADSAFTVSQIVFGRFLSRESSRFACTFPATN